MSSVNNPAMNMGAKISFEIQTSILFGKYSEV
jgi:hypothetical protein